MTHSAFSWNTGFESYALLAWQFDSPSHEAGCTGQSSSKSEPLAGNVEFESPDRVGFMFMTVELDAGRER